MSNSSAPLDLRTTREYLEMGYKIVNCPVCGSQTLDSHWICRNCGWEYDGIIDRTNYSPCNKASIADFRENKL